jgi:hypothetical protein
MSVIIKPCRWCGPGWWATLAGMAEWWSIEVLHGTVSAARWRDAYSESLLESAISNGAVDWAWHEHRWGVVLEVAFDDEEQWRVFRELPSVRAALDAVPDPINGLLVYRGRGGSAGRGARQPLRPRAGAGAVALPEPDPLPVEAPGAGPQPPIFVGDHPQAS